MATTFPESDRRPATRLDRSHDRHQPVEPRRRRRRIRARRRRHDVEQAIAVGADGVQEMVAHDAAGAVRHPRPRRHRNPGAQGRAGTAALARAGQAAGRRHRRGGARRRDLQVLRRRSGAAHGGEKIDSDAPGHRRRGHARAARRRRGDHAVELPAGDSGLEDRAGAGVRQLRRLQAGRARAGVAVDARGHRPARRPAAGRAQPGDGPRLARSAPRSPSSPDIDAVSFTGSQDVGPVGRRRRGEDRRARAARDGRQEPAHRPRRRGSGDGGVDRGQRRVLPGRPALHRVQPADRDRGHSRSLRRGDDRAHEDARRRRRAEGRDGDRPRRRSAAARQEPRVRRDRQEGRRAAGARRRAAEARDRRLLHGAGAVHRHRRRRCASTRRRSSARWRRSSA